jgi:dipeptidyl aminopeptidase/acylaminoacyl peptidase
MAGPKGMQPADVGALTDVSDPRISPDGHTVAFTVTTVDVEDNDYRSRIWLADLSGETRPRPLTRGDGKDVRARWSPDGRFLAFTSKREDEGSQLCVIPVSVAGEVRTVARSAEDIEDLAWSPDGTKLAYAARARDPRYDEKKAKDQPPRRIERFFFRLDTVGWTIDRPRKLFVADVERDGPPVQVTSGDVDDHGLSWSPDGRSIAFTSSRHENWDIDRAVDLFAVAGDPGGAGAEPEPVRLTPTALEYGHPSWSPDGTRIAVHQTDPRTGPTHNQVVVVAVAGGDIVSLTTSLDRNCAPYVGAAREPLWDGDDLVFGIEDSGNTHLYRVAADGSGKPELVVGGERTVTGWDVRDGVVAFTATTATSLPELYVRSADGTETQLTALGAPFAAAREIVEPERFTATSPDGAEVDGWIIRPVGFEAGSGRKYPMLLNIHGGPFTQYGSKFFDEFQVQAAAGYVVVYANPRGSSGYSEAWGRAIRGPGASVDPGSGWGGVDYDDLMAVVDEALERFPFIDGDRLGVLGGSYGGYMTSWIVGHTNRFVAACSERSVNNLLTMEHTSDIATMFEDSVGARHIDDPEEYRRQSPITYVRNIETPVLILHSEDDLRCPMEQAEELFIALRLLGKEVEYVRFPGESHELTRSGAPRHRVQRFEILLDFFARHLSPSPPE